MNIQTMVKQLLREIRVDRAVAAGQAVVDAKIAICDAMDQTKDEGFWYNRSWYSIDTVTEQMRYALPSDFQSLHGDIQYLSTSDDPISRQVLFPATMNLVQQVKFLGTEPDQAINSGTPSHYTIDSSTNELLLIPIPWANNDRIEFQYNSSPGVPTYIYDGSSWIFYEPWSTTVLADTYTNSFFREAYKLIFYRAAYLLLTGPHGGTESALVKSTEYIKKWGEELLRLRGEAMKRQFVPTVRPHI